MQLQLFKTFGTISARHGSIMVGNGQKMQENGGKEHKMTYYATGLYPYTPTMFLCLT